MSNFSVQSLANVFSPLHHQFFSCPRKRILGAALAEFLPNADNLSGLDIGCGPGHITKEISLFRPKIAFSGVDVIERIEPEIGIAYQTYDGQKLPYLDKSFSFSMMVDVLHHTNNPKDTLCEALRVTEDFILIKDHICESQLDRATLSFMDWIGNKSYGVHLPYNYLSHKEWQDLFEELGLSVEEKREDLKLYAPPLDPIFGRKLHFIAKLKIKR
jgi:SAM-dependent methyltransferase